MFSTLSGVLFFLASTSTLGLAAPTSLVPRQSQSFSGWADGYYIAAVGRDKKCLGLAQSPATAGVVVTTTDCADAATWRVPIQQSGGAIVHEESQLVLDIGNGGEYDQMTLQSFTGNTSSQIFKYGSDNRFVLANSSGWTDDRCIDFGQDTPHMYTCYPDNTNQAWVIRQTPEPRNLKEGVPQGGEVAVSRSDLNFIHPQGRKDICVSAISSSGPNATQGVAFTYCAGTGFAGSGYNTSHELMEWALPGSSPGQVRLGFTGLCLETGANIYMQAAPDADEDDLKVGNGMAVYIDECDDTRQGQQWSWDGQLLKSNVDNNQCLNFAAEAGYVKMDNFLNLRPLQTWDCSSPDPQFYFST